MDGLTIMAVELGILANTMYQASLIRAKHEMDFISINDNKLFQAWNVINGFILPLLILFGNVKWYMAILYFGVAMYTTSYISFFILKLFRHNNAYVSIVLNIVATILFIIYFFR